jgi:hypothetical protein
MDENHADDTSADDMVVKVANITLDCDSVVPAIMCHEPADMNGAAINHLIYQLKRGLSVHLHSNSY